MKKSIKKLKLEVFFACSICMSATVNGAILYNNIPANLEDFGLYHDGLAIFENGYLASQFSTNSSVCAFGCTLGDITLTMFSDDFYNPTGSTIGYQLQVFSDVGNFPGEALITMNNPATFNGDAANHVFVPTGILTLSSNTNYWVKFSATGGGTSATWSALQTATQSMPNQPAQFIYEGFGSPFTFFNPKLLMKVEASQTSTVENPTPGAVWLMGSALLGLAPFWRRQNP